MDKINHDNYLTIRFFCAANAGHLDKIKKMIKDHPILLSQYKSLNIAINSAIKNNHLNVVEYLISQI